MGYNRLDNDLYTWSVSAEKISFVMLDGDDVGALHGATLVVHQTTIFGIRTMERGRAGHGRSGRVPGHVLAAGGPAGLPGA